MVNSYNPFKANRTEQMKDLWKYYVPFSGMDSTGKPLVVEGGRGSGKTMFFQCNSWRQVLSKLKENNQPLSNVFSVNGFIGIYYRVDTSFVSAMCNQSEEKWSSIFETYLCICILQEILDLMNELKSGVDYDYNEESRFIANFSRKFYPNTSVTCLQDFIDETNLYLDVIEDKINGVESHISLRWVTAHRTITDMCEAIKRIFKKELLFKIFIDEYETLQEYQQRIINTLIKHSELPVVFNVGLRPHGMKTNGTISATETIEAPHDYEMISLGIEGGNDYTTILKEICKKRIQLGKEENKIPKDASENIEFYLGNYSIDYEIQHLNSKSHLDKLKKRITEMGKEENMSAKQIDDCITVLCDESDLISSRLHYALICKKTKYTPKLTELYDAYTKQSQRYLDWVHNRKNGVVYLLCKESKREKMYYGFDVYVALSSNIVRYFLELCEHAFTVAFFNDFAWNSTISPEIQTEAARYVSEYKIVDIAGYEPYGKRLRIFIQYLGKIFYKLHTEENTTLGEPEPNHFNTKDLSLSDDDKALISSAIMWNVLQEGEPTKRKNSKLSPETVDYYINKIYTPYFGISFRNQRKILLDVDILELLLSGNEENAKKGFLNFFRLSEIKDEVDEQAYQVSLFDYP